MFMIVWYVQLQNVTTTANVVFHYPILQRGGGLGGGDGRDDTKALLTFGNARRIWPVNGKQDVRVDTRVIRVRPRNRDPSFGEDPDTAAVIKVVVWMLGGWSNQRPTVTSPLNIH